MEIPIKKASDRHICFAGPMGHFCSYHESLHLFATAMVIKKGTLRTTPFLTKAHPHSGTEVKGARQMCKRPPPRNSNMQAPGSTQNKYASTRWHAKQMCRHLAARKTNMEAPGGTQHKYAGSQQQEKTNVRAPGSTQKKYVSMRWHAKQICHHLVARKTHMAFTWWHAQQICKRPSPRTTNMQAPGSTQNKYSSTC